MIEFDVPTNVVYAAPSDELLTRFCDKLANALTANGLPHLSYNGRVYPIQPRTTISKVKQHLVNLDFNENLRNMNFGTDWVLSVGSGFLNSSTPMAATEIKNPFAGLTKALPVVGSFCFYYLALDCNPGEESGVLSDWGFVLAGDNEWVNESMRTTVNVITGQEGSDKSKGFICCWTEADAPIPEWPATGFSPADAGEYESSPHQIWINDKGYVMCSRVVMDDDAYHADCFTIQSTLIK